MKKIHFKVLILCPTSNLIEADFRLISSFEQRQDFLISGLFSFSFSPLDLRKAELCTFFLFFKTITTILSTHYNFQSFLSQIVGKLPLILNNYVQRALGSTKIWLEIHMKFNGLKLYWVKHFRFDKQRKHLIKFIIESVNNLIVLLLLSIFNLCANFCQVYKADSD